MVAVNVSLQSPVDVVSLLPALANNFSAALPAPSLAEICRLPLYLVFMTILDELIRKNEKISGVCERVVPVETPDDEYDFIVVGGGAAGCVVAARLSENPKWKIGLIEAGPDQPVGAQVPMFMAALIGTRVDWNFLSTNEPCACKGTFGVCLVSAGKMFGGSMAHNGMLYARGNPTDYNKWAKLGNEGWEWDKVLPYFLKSEDNGEIERVGRSWHATGGPLSVERSPYLAPFGYSIMDAGAQAGYGVSDDPNGANVSGFAFPQSTMKQGVRRTSASAFLWPARNRKNLHVLLDSQVTKVIIENKTAVGVEYFKNGVLKKIRATREVILSAGAIGSPHILLQSGIGPKDHLQSKDIEVVHDLPGVGENLHDHVGMLVDCTINETYTYDNDWNIASEYLKNQTGPLSANGEAMVVGTLASSATTPDHPDIKLLFESHFVACAPGNPGALVLPGRRHVFLHAAYLHTKSRGRVRLVSKIPLTYPDIRFNHLSNDNDVKGLVEAVEMVVAMTKTDAFRAHDFTLTPIILPQCLLYEFPSTAYWNCAVHYGQAGVAHIGGSCKMGPATDNMAVVDPRLRVYGIKGLRVVDTSIMPQPVSANTGAPAVMFGERGADFIKEDWDYHGEVTDRSQDSPTPNTSKDDQTRGSIKPDPLTSALRQVKLTIP